MALSKYIFRFFDTTFGLLIGVNMIDMFTENGLKVTDVIQLIDAKVKILMAVIGLIYYIISGVHKWHMNKLEREEKKLRNKMLKDDLELKEFNNEKEINANKVGKL